MQITSIRTGNFTSSEIASLLSKGKDKNEFGKPALTYIEEKIFERRLGRSLSSDTSSRPTSWGKLVEEKVFELLSLDYNLKSSEPIKHHTIDCWVGTPDVVKEDTVGDIKCPYSIKSFCQKADYIIDNDLDAFKKNDPDYYWQIVSNAILTNSTFGELIIYCPYLHELPSIRELTQGVSGEEQHKYQFIYFAQDEDLPHLFKGLYYNNIYTFRFEIPKEDKELLTEAVLKASKLLCEFSILQQTL